MILTRRLDSVFEIYECQRTCEAVVRLASWMSLIGVPGFEASTSRCSFQAICWAISRNNPCGGVFDTAVRLVQPVPCSKLKGTAHETSLFDDWFFGGGFYGVE